MATRDDVRDLFARHGLPDVFDWAEDVMGDVIEITPARTEELLVVPATLVVDGDLHVTGTIEVPGLLIVMGNVSARAFHCTGAAFVKGDLTANCTVGDGADVYCQKLAGELVGEVHYADRP